MAPIVQTAGLVTIAVTPSRAIRVITVVASALVVTHMRINSNAAAKRAADQVETILATLAQLKVNTVLSPERAPIFNRVARRFTAFAQAFGGRARSSRRSADVGRKVSKVDARRYVWIWYKGIPARPAAARKRCLYARKNAH